MNPLGYVSKTPYPLCIDGRFVPFRLGAHFSHCQSVALANQSRYGLAGAVFTRDIRRAHRVVERLRAGQIYVNSYYSKGMVESPGTGWKQSGLGGAGIVETEDPPPAA